MLTGCLQDTVSLLSPAVIDCYSLLAAVLLPASVPLDIAPCDQVMQGMAKAVPPLAAAPVTFMLH